MTKWSHLALPSLAVLAVAIASGGCSPASTENNGPPPVITAPPPGGPGGPGPASPVKQIMMKFRGPQGLTAKIGTELNADAPPWDDLQAQSKDLNQQAAALAPITPRKGNKETWDKHVQDFAALTADLDSAVQAKDQAKAKDAQVKLGPQSAACMDCHKDHRGR